MIRNFLKTVYRVLPGKLWAFNAIRGVARLPEGIYRHLHFQGPFRVKLPSGRRFKMMHFGNQVENDLFWAGYGNGWERSSLRIWSNLAANAYSILDIGANTGTFTFAAQAANPEARCEAFEPVARIFDRLSINAELNGNKVGVNCIALSDHNGTATLFDSGEAHVYSASLNTNMLGEKGLQAKSEVPVTTLDHFRKDKEMEPIDLIKLDVEMHEPEVLRGASQTLKNDRPAILIEILNRDTGAEVACLLDEYILFEIIEGEGLVRSDCPGESGERNYLALHRDAPQIKLIGDRLEEARFGVLG